MAVLSWQRLLPVVGSAVVMIAGGAALSGCAGEGAPESDASQPSATEQPASPAPETPAATPEEQAAADLEALVRGFRAVEDQAYMDQAMDPAAAFDPFIRNPAAMQAIASVLAFRAEGNTMSASRTEVHSVQVTTLDLAAVTAAFVECKTSTVAGTDPSGQAQGGTNPRRKVEWTAEIVPGVGWRLNTAIAQGNNSC